MKVVKLSRSRFIQNVRRIVEGKIAAALSVTGDVVSSELLEPGKMLRTRLAARLFDPSLAEEKTVQVACAATELVHTAQKEEFKRTQWPSAVSPVENVKLRVEWAERTLPVVETITGNMPTIRRVGESLEITIGRIEEGEVIVLAPGKS